MEIKIIYTAKSESKVWGAKNSIITNPALNIKPYENQDDNPIIIQIKNKFKLTGRIYYLFNIKSFVNNVNMNISNITENASVWQQPVYLKITTGQFTHTNEPGQAAQVARESSIINYFTYTHFTPLEI